jgi:hypothetical protein
MITRYYISQDKELKVKIRASDEEMELATEITMDAIKNLVRVDFVGYWLAKFGFMKLAMKFKVAS